MSRNLSQAPFNRDYRRWINQLGDFTGKWTTHQLNALQDIIISAKDAPLAYFFALEFGHHTYRMQQLILRQTNPQYVFLFARHIPNADIKACRAKVMEVGKVSHITKFACFVPTADQKALEPLIIKANDPKYACLYLRQVKTANLSRLKKIIMQSGKPSHLLELAKHCPKDLNKIEDLIIASGSCLHIRLFAEKIKGANIDKLERAILDTHNEQEIRKFAQCVKGSKMRQFLLVG